jgi:hypothetical protein
MTMRPIGEIADAMGSSLVSTWEEPRKARGLTDHDTQVVNTLFKQLKVVFPAWQRAFPSAESQAQALREWTLALIDAQCTSAQQLEMGMRKAREQDIPFFPSPGMFIKWCEISPESLGLPSVEQALADVARHRKTHPAVVLAARATRFERQTLSSDEYSKVFAHAYEQVMRRVIAGEDLAAAVLKGLPTQSQIQHNPEYYHEVGQRGVSSLKALFKRGGMAHAQTN